MAARGAESKEKVAEIILQTFPAAFRYEKEIRIPMVENGEEVQIKVTLTAAKANVSAGGDTALPGEQVIKASNPSVESNVKVPIEPTEEEKKNVSDLLTLLGL